MQMRDRRLSMNQNKCGQNIECNDMKYLVILINNILILASNVLKIVDSIQYISKGLEKNKLHYLLTENSSNVTLESNILLVECQNHIEQGLS